MIYLIANITALIFASWLFYPKVAQIIPKWAYWLGFAYKCLAGIGLGLLFYYQYGFSDSFSYYHLASQWVESQESFWDIISRSYLETNEGSRVIFFVKILYFLLIITGGSYWIVSIYFSTISFFVSCYVVRELAKFYPTHRKLFIAIFLFIPSIVFWSSGVMKGALANSAFVFTIIATLKIYWNQKFTLGEIVVAGISLFLLLNLKHYLAITVFLFSGLLFFVLLYKKFRGLIRWVMPALVLSGFLIIAQFVHPYLNINRIPLTLYDTNQAILSNTIDERQTGVEIDSPSWFSVVSEIPIAIYTGLFRPHFYDQTPPWGIIHKVENFLLSTFLFLSLILIVRSKVQLDWVLVFISVSCILFLLTMLSLSTPNLGSLVRYKNAYMPFLVLIVSVLPFHLFTSKSS